ncbi:hypothetical protein [Marinisporobacter balticus]|uniref:Uncharacterized protein n=1 Tax=Marinisporobacter balticus TaxID=2018667 RepID=A0A4R2KZ16_9FIRM|nr:hypothetical protein [Marinisporobacter balticus]TCO79921.1 hypothetical protein EV214_101155 [Marinisporobacter balticus]
MKIIKSIPYIFLIFSIIVSTIIAMMNNISFIVFLKRTSILYVIIFLATKSFISNLVKVEESSNHMPKIEGVVASEKFENGMDEKKAEDDFIPLDLG